MSQTPYKAFKLNMQMLVCFNNTVYYPVHFAVLFTKHVQGHKQLI